MNFLVIGGTGFIGSYIVEALLNNGHRVRVLDRTIKIKVSSQNKAVEYISGDYGNTSIIRDVLKDINYVVHLASSTVPSSSNKDPVFDIDTNLIKTIKLLQEMENLKIKNILYFSSGGTVYGEPEYLPIKEDHEKNPICSYGITKVAVENYLYLFQHLYGFKPIILRPSNPFGPRQGHFGSQGAIAIFTDRIINKKPITIWGDGQIKRDYVFISDLICAFAKAINLSRTGTYNIGSGEGIKLLDVIKSIEGYTGVDATINFEAPRDFDIQEIILDISKAETNLAWKPQVDFKSGIERHCNWYIENMRKDEKS